MVLLMPLMLLLFGFQITHCTNNYLKINNYMMRYILLLSGLLLFALSVKSQTYCLRLSEMANNGTTVIYRVEMLGDQIFGLGTSNLEFSFNNSGLSNPTLESSFLGGNYSVTVTSPLTAVASVNIVFNSSPAVQVSTA